jgi:hypothetical protein
MGTGEQEGSVATLRRQRMRGHDGAGASACNLEQPSDEMELADNLADAHLACPFRIACTAS